MGDIVGQGDIFVTTTGNKGILTAATMGKMKNNAIVGNIGHFDNEIDMAGLEKITKRINIKPQVDRFVFPEGKGIIVLAEGRLLKLSCGPRRPRGSTRLGRCTSSRRSWTRRWRGCTSRAWGPS